MINDIRTVFWKERRAQSLKGMRSVASARTLVLLILVGGILPYEFRTLWTHSLVSVFAAIWVTFYGVTTVMADSIAGERERRTLEALLSTPLSRAAIVWGKMLAAVSDGWGRMLLAMLVALIAGNWAQSWQQWHGYSLLAWVGIVVDGGLAGSMAAGLGLWVSTQSHSVRQAQQILSGSALGLAFIPLILQSFFHVSFLTTLRAMPNTVQILEMSTGLLSLNVLFLAVGQWNFRRSDRI